MSDKRTKKSEEPPTGGRKKTQVSRSGEEKSRERDLSGEGKKSETESTESRNKAPEPGNGGGETREADLSGEGQDPKTNGQSWIRKFSNILKILGAVAGIIVGYFVVSEYFVKKNSRMFNYQIIVDQSEDMSSGTVGNRKWNQIEADVTKALDNELLGDPKVSLRRFGDCCRSEESNADCDHDSYKAKEDNRIVPFGIDNQGAIKEKLRTPSLEGEPTMLDALKYAVEDFSKVSDFHPDAKMIIYVFSSHIDGCLGDDTVGWIENLHENSEIKVEWRFSAVAVPEDEREKWKKLQGVSKNIRVEFVENAEQKEDAETREPGLPSGNGHEDCSASSQAEVTDFRDPINIETEDYGPIMLAVPLGDCVLRADSGPRTSQDSHVRSETPVRAFAIGKYETTYDEYDRFAEAVGRHLPKDYGMGREDRPVVGISWYDARAYANWLSEQTGEVYRLPSEAEWDYAARAGTETEYWWGAEYEDQSANCLNCDAERKSVKTVPVGTFDSNPFGLHDTAGNVSEWVENCWLENPVEGSTSGVALDCTRRVLRGGSWGDTSDYVTSNYRTSSKRSTRSPRIGFRIARTMN